MQAVFRFHGILEDHLPPGQRGRPLFARFDAGQTVKHLIASLGVPHPEVGRVVVNGVESTLSRQVQDGDDVQVCERAPGHAGEPRFVLDTHLGRLASYLRMLGFDTLYKAQAADEDLARTSSEEQRILLTRDRPLLMRSVVVYGYYVRETHPHRQLVEAVRRFSLAGRAKPFSRCLRCNTLLRPAHKADVWQRVPLRSRVHYEDFHECPSCGRIYWNGSHVRRMQRLMDHVLSASAR